MVSLPIHSLLFKVARAAEGRAEHFSRQEITKKINEIKYLSTHKKIPRLTLRKELLHLEHKLSGLDKIEEQLRKKERRENSQTAFLKKQVAMLKQKIAVSEDKDIGKKVEKLSFLLGECLAKKEIPEDIVLSEKMKLEALQQDQGRIGFLQRRLDALKQKLPTLTDPLKRVILEKQIGLIEEKLAKYLPSEKREPGEIKHDLLFTAPVQQILPLPPPPKRILRA